MQKTIIVLKGVHNSGKTTTIKKVDCLLRNQYEVRLIIDRKSRNRMNEINEIRVAMEIMDKRIRIGINSQGDDAGRLGGQLESLKEHKEDKEHKCDIIVAAARIWIETGDNGYEGKPVERVKEYARKHGYRIVPVYNKQQSDKFEFHNQKLAEEIVGIIEELLNGQS